jgi:hypothetical protein
LKNQILKQPPHGIIGKRCHNGRIQAKAAFQSTRDVVFATTLINVKIPGRPNPLIARIKP